jgi:hypothetical protein
VPPALLDRRFDLLQRSAPAGRARHRSLRAAIDTSYALLEPGDQAFFRALGVFASPFSARLAHEVAAPADFDLLHTVDGLSRLVDRSLLAAAAGGGVTRYRLLESLRAYAGEHARAAGEWDGLMDRFVDAMVGEADRIVAAGAARWSDARQSVLTQHDALVAAIDHAIVADADASRAFRLLLPQFGAVHQGRASEVAAAGERVLRRWPAGDEPLRAEAGAVAAAALMIAGDVTAACALAQRQRRGRLTHRPGGGATHARHLRRERRRARYRGRPFHRSRHGRGQCRAGGVRARAGTRGRARCAAPRRGAGPARLRPGPLRPHLRAPRKGGTPCTSNIRAVISTR